MGVLQLCPALRVKKRSRNVLNQSEKSLSWGGGATQAKTAETAPADIGKNRYEQTCQMCHQAGLADAPKLGDKKAWGPRIAQGMETLLKHAMEGLKAMPPKGGCTTCDEAEIKKTIEYMVSQSK